MLNPYENAGSVETPEETEEERLMREMHELQVALNEGADYSEVIFDLDS